LVLSVALSDRFLAGRLLPVPQVQRAEALSQQVLALTLLGGTRDGLGAALAAEAPWELARQTAAQQVAYQSAQTTANYLAWCIISYTILVSVAGTALVARFTGAGDRRLAIHATNQTLLLAA